jgi:hypothetical protein
LKVITGLRWSAKHFRFDLFDQLPDLFDGPRFQYHRERDLIGNYFSDFVHVDISENPLPPRFNNRIAQSLRRRSRRDVGATIDQVTAL